MARGPAGGPRPFAEDTITVQFSILTGERLGQTVARRRKSSLNITAGAAKAESTQGSGDDITIKDVEAKYDTRENNLHIAVSLKTAGMPLARFESFVKEFHKSLAESIEEGQMMDLDTTAPDDLPPNQDTFKLIDQGGLENQIFIRQ